MVRENPQAWNKQDENIGSIPTGQFYARPVGTGIGAGVSSDENIGSIPTGQFYASPAGTNTGTESPKEENSPGSKGQSDGQPASKGTNNGLNKALLGGLIGATLGTLAAALANKRTAQGANHAAKGVGKAAKSVTEGVNHAAKNSTRGDGVTFPTHQQQVNVSFFDCLQNCLCYIMGNSDLGMNGNFLLFRQNFGLT